MNAYTFASQLLNHQFFSDQDPASVHTLENRRSCIKSVLIACLICVNVVFFVCVGIFAFHLLKISEGKFSKYNLCSCKMKAYYQQITVIFQRRVNTVFRRLIRAKAY